MLFVEGLTIDLRVVTSVLNLTNGRSIQDDKSVYESGFILILGDGNLLDQFHSLSIEIALITMGVSQIPCHM